MIPHLNPPMDSAMDRDREQFRLSKPPYSNPSPNYRRHAPHQILPSIMSVFGDLGRRGAPIPQPPHTPYPGSYTPESPIRHPAAPPAIAQYIHSSDEPWSTQKQAPKHHLPPAIHHYPGEFLRPLQTYADSEANTEMCSDPGGESEFTSGGVCDTHSQAGSSISAMYLRQFVCRTCKQMFKCDSLLRKHEMKHTKPFRCHIPGCKRQAQGFTSANDRDRHMNSVHKRSSGRGAVGYDCVYDHCGGNGKIFWRLDNFRNHLKKKHVKKDGDMEEFLKRAESDCRRVFSHIPDGAESPMDTQSEPGYPQPLTPGDGPHPPMSDRDDFPMPRQKRVKLPPVPTYHSGCWSDSEGHGALPISPVSRGPNQDLASDGGERMDLDDPPGPPGPPESPNAVRAEGPHSAPMLPRMNSKAPPERVEKGKANDRRDSAKSARRAQRLGELHELIKKYPRILDEYNELCREEREEHGDAGQNWPQYQYLYPVGSSEISARTMSIPKTRITQRHTLDRIEESDQDRPRHGPLTSRTLQNNSGEGRHHGHGHALHAYVRQSPTDESPMSRLLLSSGGATAAGPSENQGALISPPTSVASPQAAATELRQPIVIPDDEPAFGPGRAQRRSSIGMHAAARPTPVLVPNEKSTICPECDKVFTLPSKLKKHMKRHSRPYACTFRGCGKFFGSKNDWKRHENSQHFQLELWKCGVIPLKSPTLCGKLSFRRESHTTHLKNAHNITDKNEIAIKTKEAHIGRNNFKTFWCGFCPTIEGNDAVRGRVVRLQKKGLDGWDERFDHLGKHFIEDQYKISRYTFHDDDDQYGSPETSSDEDGEDGEITTDEPVLPIYIEEDDVLGDLGDEDKDPGQKVLEFTAPDGPKDQRLAKKTPRPQKLQAAGNKEFRWYCCNAGRGGPCPDPGPYTDALHGACIACGHQQCRRCRTESHDGNPYDQLPAKMGM